MAKILIVEDDPEYSQTIAECLELSRHQVEQAYDGEEALQFLKQYSYDAVILDWQLPKMLGVEVMKAFRGMGGRAPILMLTGNDSYDSRAEGLDSGADDYLIKPFNPQELTARVRALLRRPPSLLDTSLRFRHITLDPNKRAVTVEGAAIDLLPREFALLEFFLKHPSRVFSADELIAHVWPADAVISSEVVRSAVNRLRTKLDKKGENSIIKTIYSVGYGLQS